MKGKGLLKILLVGLMVVATYGCATKEDLLKNSMKLEEDNKRLSQELESLKAEIRASIRETTSKSGESLAELRTALNDYASQTTAQMSSQTEKIQQVEAGWDAFKQNYDQSVHDELTNNLEYSRINRSLIAKLANQSEVDTSSINTNLSTSSDYLSTIKRNRDEAKVQNVINEFKALRMKMAEVEGHFEAVLAQSMNYSRSSAMRAEEARNEALAASSFAQTAQKNASAAASSAGKVNGFGSRLSSMESNVSNLWKWKDYFEKNKKDSIAYHNDHYDWAYGEFQSLWKNVNNRFDDVYGRINYLYKR